MKKVKEKGMEIVFLIAACVSILSVALICIFLFMNGIPAIKEIGFFNFVGGKIWKPGNNIFGILPMILGSIYVTAGALVIGVPIGILTAVFLARGSARGNPVCRIWIFRTLCAGSLGEKHLRWKWKQHFNGIGSAWYHDPAKHHRSFRIGDPGSAEQIL